MWPVIVKNWSCQSEMKQTEAFDEQHSFYEEFTADVDFL